MTAQRPVQRLRSRLEPSCSISIPTTAFRTAGCRCVLARAAAASKRATARRPARCSGEMAGRGPGSATCCRTGISIRAGMRCWPASRAGRGSALAAISGIEVDVETGDACVIPAGVGHIRLDGSGDFRMAGGYPPGQQGNIVRPGDLDDATIAREIAALALPATDPLSGKADGVVAIWRAVRSVSTALDRPRLPAAAPACGWRRRSPPARCRASRSRLGICASTMTPISVALSGSSDSISAKLARGSRDMASWSQM